MDRDQHDAKWHERNELIRKLEREVDMTRAEYERAQRAYIETGERWKDAVKALRDFEQGRMP